MDNRLAVSEQEAYELLGFLMASAETSTFEPHPYSVLRIVEAASRLMGFMLAHDSGGDLEWLKQFKDDIDAKKGWINRDLDASAAFIRDANADLAQQLKRRIMAENDSQPANG
jgi:hypothetical protein